MAVKCRFVAATRPAWRVLKVSPHSGPVSPPGVAATRPAWRVLKDSVRVSISHKCAFVAATRPAWRVLKGDHIGGAIGDIGGCSDSTRLEGTERCRSDGQSHVGQGCSDSTRLEGTESANE